VRGVIRRTALEAFAVCPLRYKRLYRERNELTRRRPVDTDTSPDARRGSAFHLAMREYIRGLVACRQPHAASLAEMAFQRAMQVDNSCSDEVAALFFPFVRHDFTLDLDAFLECETRQTANARYTFQPDLVYARPDRLQVVDFKTHYAAWTEHQAAREPQARLYGLFSSQVWPGFDQYEVTFWFVRLKRQVSAVFDRTALEKIAGEVKALETQLAAAIEADDFPPTPGQHCGFCRFACPIADDERKLPIRITTAQDAVALAGRKLVLDRESLAITKALSGYCLTEGEVVVNGMAFAHRPRNRRIWPIEAVMDALRDAGVIPNFTIGATALKPYLSLKKFDRLKVPLEALAALVPGSIFSARKIGEVEDEEDVA
jgi:hypothetical protein